MHYSSTAASQYIWQMSMKCRLWQCDHRKTCLHVPSAGGDRVSCNHEHVGGSEIYQITYKHKKPILCLDLGDKYTTCKEFSIFNLCVILCKPWLLQNTLKWFTVWLKAEGNKSVWVREPEGWSTSESKVLLIKASLHNDKVKENSQNQTHASFSDSQNTQNAHTHTFQDIVILHAKTRH